MANENNNNNVKTAYELACAIPAEDMHALTLIKDRNAEGYDKCLDDVALKLDALRDEDDDSKRDALNKEIASLKADVLKASRNRFIGKTVSLSNTNLVPVHLIRALYPFMSTARWTIKNGTYCASVDTKDFVDFDTMFNDYDEEKQTALHNDIRAIRAMISTRVDSMMKKDTGIGASNTKVKEKISEFIRAHITDEKLVVATADIMQLERIFTETRKNEPNVLRAVSDERFEMQFMRVVYRIVSKGDYKREELKK